MEATLGMTLELFTATGALIGGSIAFLLDEQVLSLLFGALLLYAAFTMARSRAEVEPETLPTAGGSGTPAPIGAAALDLGNTPDWPALTVWLSALIHARGDDIVRIKGIVRTPRGRILLQSVRKVVQSPEILGDEPAAAENRDGLLVLIGRRFTAGELVRSLNAFGIGGAVAIEAEAASGDVRRPDHGEMDERTDAAPKQREDSRGRRRAVDPVPREIAIDVVRDAAGRPGEE